jgi:hypothetical protein
MSEESVKKQIEGFCEEISEKNDWTTFNINVGRQYPVRLSTKLEALVKAGREAKNNKAVWTFSESQGGENPNKPGTFYLNRRLEKVEVGGALDPAVAQGGPTGSTAGGRSVEERHSIERQTIIKAACAMDREWEDDDEFFKFITKLDAWMQRPVAAPAAKPDPVPAPPVPESSGDPAWPDADGDDIPF